MTFEEILDRAIAMLSAAGLTYGTLKRQFQLDDAALEDLTNELIKGQRLARDEDGEVLVWTGASVAPPGAHPHAAARHSAGAAGVYPTYLVRRSSPPEVPWKASANRSPCCLPTSKAPRS